MNKKKIVLIIIFVILIVLVFVMGIIAKNEESSKHDDYKKIPDNYIAVFHGGVGEVTYETYIYKIKNEPANYGFRYINTTSHTKHWGSTEWETKITKKGKFSWTDEAFVIAEKNGAYDYVKLPNDNKTYSIEEFQRMFLLN